jgi:proliferating cell nuclear antigen
LRLVFMDARVWRYVVTAVSKTISEAVFKASEEGFSLRAMDPSRITMVDLFFPSTAFDEYSVEGVEELGVNMEDLARILRRAGKEDQLELESAGDRLAIVFRGKSTRKFVIPLLSLEAEELPEPRIELKAKARMLSTIFREIIKDLEPIGDMVTFELGPEKLVARSVSDLGEAEVELTLESGNLIEAEAEGVERASYSLDYFSDIVTAAQAADLVTLHLGTDMPCRIEYSLPQGARLDFYVAPRVE